MADDEGCIKNDTKHKCSKIVFFISVALFVIAIALIGYAAASYGGIEKISAGNYDAPFKFEQNSVAFAMCVVGGVISLIISIMGCLTVKFKNPCVTLPFILCSFIIAIFCMAVGGVVMSADIQKKACFEKITVGSREVDGNTLAKEYSQFVDKSLCSSACPCPKSAESQWQTAAPEADLKVYKRSWTGSSVAKPFQNKDTVVPMSFQQSGTTYVTFKGCYDGVLKKQAKNDMSEQYKNAMDAFSREGEKFFAQIEKTYKCAGICEKGLFYVSKPITDGRPETSCVDAFQKKYGSNYGVAAIAFITAIVLIVAGIAALPLCTGFKQRSEADLEKP